jgi:hypothetical protein
VTVVVEQVVAVEHKGEHAVHCNTVQALLDLHQNFLDMVEILGRIQQVV